MKLENVLISQIMNIYDINQTAWLFIFHFIENEFSVQ